MHIIITLCARYIQIEGIVVIIDDPSSLKNKY
jgi:hypothetical protein